MKEKLEGLIVGYARVSSQEQAENSHALEQQIERLKQAGAEQIYCDVISGNKSDRPQFLELMKRVEKGQVKKIIATRWDRLTRNEELYFNLKKILLNSKVSLLLLDQGVIDLSTAAGELSSDLQAIFAVHERRMLRERVLHGFRHRRKRLAASGRAPFGYIVRNDKYRLNTQPIVCLLEDKPTNYRELYDEPDHSEKLLGRSKAQIAQEMIQLFIEVKKPRQVLSDLHQKYGVVAKPETNSGISQELILPRSTTHFREWLLNPVLQGHTAYLKYEDKGQLKGKPEWEIYRDTHPDQVLVTPEQVQNLEDIIKINHKKIGKSQRTFYLTGLVFCAQCGYKGIFKNSGSGKYKYYACRQAKMGCNNSQSTRFEFIDQAIIDALFSQANVLHQNPKTHENDSLNSQLLEEMKAQLAGLEKVPGLENNLLLANAKTELMRKIELERQRIQNTVPLEGTAQEIINHPYARNLSFWYGLNEEERTAIYYKLIHQVFISNGKVVSVSLRV